MRDESDRGTELRCSPVVIFSEWLIAATVNREAKKAPILLSVLAAEDKKQAAHLYHTGISFLLRS